MKIKIKNILFGSALALTVLPMATSCEDYLDVDKYFYDMTSLDSVFVRKANLYQYLNAGSAAMPRMDYLWTWSPNPWSFCSDEAFSSWKDGNHPGVAYALGEVDRFTGTFNNWEGWYKGIRRANMIIQRIGECQDLSEMERRDVTGQAYFLRAYLYWCLVQEYGPVPILPDTPLPSNGSVEELSFQRSTYDECIDYIVKNFNEAAKLLDSERSVIAEYRVPTRGAAMAIASRVLLEAASPWFNGNPYYSDFRRSSDNALYFNQEADNSKWGKAAAMAKRVIDTGLYKIYTASRDKTTPDLPAEIMDKNFPDGAKDVDPYQSFYNMFSGEELAINIPEIIWAGSEYNKLSGISFPSNAMQGGNGLCVSQQLVDAFRMANGKDINDPGSGYPSADEAWKEIGETKNFSGYQLLKSAAKMYDNREMRFYATIGYNHTFREASSYTGTASDHKNLEVTYYSNGTGRPSYKFPDDYTRTGYTCVKYVHTSDCPTTDFWEGTYRQKYFPIIRYAEVLLNYVEAMNEMENDYTDEENNVTVSRNVDEMVKYFNMIRFRAGLPGITATDAQDRTKMRSLIKRERQVELACEGRRAFDLRRWGEMVSTLQSPFYGMNTSAKSSERQKYHTRTQMTYKYAIYNVTNKMMLYPIYQGILDRNAKLDQNPGW